MYEKRYLITFLLICLDSQLSSCLYSLLATEAARNSISTNEKEALKEISNQS